MTSLATPSGERLPALWVTRVVITNLVENLSIAIVDDDYQRDQRYALKPQPISLIQNPLVRVPKFARSRAALSQADADTLAARK